MGRVKDDSWKSAVRIMKNPKKFLGDLKEFKTLVENGTVPETNITAATKIQTSMGDDFTMAGMARKSRAAAGLVAWVINILRYHAVMNKFRADFGGSSEALMA